LSKPVLRTNTHYRRSSLISNLFACCFPAIPYNLSSIHQAQIFLYPGMPGIKIIILSLVVLCCSFSSSLHKHEDTSVSESDANRYMWDQLHLGNYDSIPKIIEKLESAWCQSTEDPALNKRLGFVYLWKFCERERMEHDSSIFRNVFISNEFFKKAIKLDPADDRIYSLQAAAQLCEGAILEDDREIRGAYLKALKAVKKWPQFNRFSLAAIESTRHKNSRMFREGLRFQWITMDECSCKKLEKKEILEHPERVIPELISELQQSSDPKIKRACWNTWIAPHNFEGYLLNFGDMLVKRGYLKEAKQMYAAIKLSPSYKDWPYQSVLEGRIRDAELNEKEFNKPFQLIISSDSKQIFINSKFSCVGCHQMSKHEFETMKREEY
jgi:hypothetical protein